jgi:CRP-like cAMP-binding protein
VVLGGEEIASAALGFGEKFPDVSAGSSTMGIYFLKITPTQLEFIDNTQAGGEKSSEQFGVEYRRESVLNVFSDLPEEAPEEITGQLQTMQVDAGEVLVRQGGPADKFFIVVDGELEIVRDDDGQERSVGSVGPGQLFGEISIMRDAPRAATLKAVNSTTLLAMERDTFRDLVAQSLGTTQDFDQVIQQRLERLREAT